MSRTTKLGLIVAASLVLIGCILFVCIMSTLGWDFAKLSTVKYETNTYEISEAFDGISVRTDTADIVFKPSDDGKCRVQCHEEENSKHSVGVKDGTLKIEISALKFIGYIGLNFDSLKITVYLPKAEYNSLLVRGSTCDLEMTNNYKFNDDDISLSTGDVDFRASASDMIKIKTSTGDITLSNVVAAEKLSIERSTGDVKFNGCDADEIYVKTDTGDVTGSLRSDKVFITNTDTGGVDVPKTVHCGRCEIITNTGDVKITVKHS